MSDASTSLLIEIKTALDAGALDLAKQKMGGLIDSQQAATDASVDMKQAESAEQQQLNDTAQSQQRVVAGLGNMSRAMQGGNESIRSLSRMFAEMGGTLGQVAGSITMVGAAFAGGWRFGRQIAEVTGLDDSLTKLFTNIEDNGDNTGKRIRGVRTEMEGLAAARLTAMVNDVNSMNDALTESAERAEKARRRIDELEQANMELAKAQIEASDKTPEEKTKLIADLKLRTEERKASRELQNIEAEGARNQSQVSAEVDARNELEARLYGTKKVDPRKLKLAMLRLELTGEKSDILADAARLTERHKRETAAQIAELNKSIDVGMERQLSLQGRADVLTTQRQTERITTETAIAGATRSEVDKAAKSREDDLKEDDLKEEARKAKEATASMKQAARDALEAVKEQNATAAQVLQDVTKQLKLHSSKLKNRP